MKMVLFHWFSFRQISEPDDGIGQIVDVDAAYADGVASVECIWAASVECDQILDMMLVSADGVASVTLKTE